MRGVERGGEERGGEERGEEEKGGEEMTMHPKKQTRSKRH